MMSNVNPGIADPAAATGQSGHPNPRNLQFRIPVSQHDMSGHSSSAKSADPTFAQPRLHSNMPPSLHGPSAHSIQYPHSSQGHSPYSASQSQHTHQSLQHQQRPPIPPTYQPRLHHSTSVGNISLAANASRYSGAGQSSAGPTAPNAVGGAAPPKKKDPYATAWRTYSKIAEELQLRNPDGTLYPISKEAILKYLHHQSKRIKSSNLHWYVNGLKKHQENLGFPWDDIRYDEQVVGLLKELTLHPATTTENGDENDGFGGGGHGYGSHAGRQRQSSGMFPPVKTHSVTSSIDTTRIANLSISQPQQQPPHHQQTQRQQMMHGSSYGDTGPKQHQGHPQYIQQQPHHQHVSSQSQRSQPPVPSKPYSAPIHLPSHHIRTPSSQDPAYQSNSHHSHHHVGGSMDTHNIRPDTTGHHVSSTLTKRKRDDVAYRKRRMPANIGEENEDDELQDDEIKDDEFDIDERHGHDINDSDEMEDPNRYQPLKRRASTGTLLGQARAQAVKHIPGPFGIDRQHHHHHHGQHPYSRQSGHVRDSSSSGNGMIHHRNPSDLHRKQHLRSPSPDLRDNEGDGGGNGSQILLNRHTNDSSPVSGGGGRQTNSGGNATSPTNSSRLLAPGTSPSNAATSASVPASGSGIRTGGKTTVQFSEVVECAQQLQAKYGNRCKIHRWGCVEITEHHHLELTIKMYIDWAGLVASGRLTMDELPDLPEFRNIHPVVGGTLKRMASTPLSSITGASLSASRNSRVASTSSPIPETSASMSHRDAPEDSSYPGSNDRNYYGGPYRSPSSSPPNRHLNHHKQLLQDKDMAVDESNLHGDMGSSGVAGSTQRLIPSPPPIGGTSNNREVSDRSHHPRARKMPSTPSLGQHHRQGLGHYPSRHRHDKRISMASISTTSSPSSDADMLEDDDDAEDDEEAIDANHYALSPWAEAPKDIAAARAAAVRARSAKSSHQTASPFPSSPRQEHGTFKEQIMGSKNESSGQDAQQRQKDESDPLESHQNKLRARDTGTEKMEGGSVLSMDSEGAVTAIGEISNPTVAGSSASAINTTGDDPENICDNNCHGVNSESVDITTTKGEDNIPLNNRSEENVDSLDHGTNLGEKKGSRVDQNPIQDLGQQGRSMLEQEDSIMVET